MAGPKISTPFFLGNTKVEVNTLGICYMKGAKIHHSPPTNWLILTHLGPRDREVNGSGSHEKHGTPLATTPTPRHVGISMMIVEHEKCNRKKPGGVKKLYCYMMWKRSVSKWKNECENDIVKMTLRKWKCHCGAVFAVASNSVTLKVDQWVWWNKAIQTKSVHLVQVGRVAALFVEGS